MEIEEVAAVDSEIQVEEFSDVSTQPKSSPVTDVARDAIAEIGEPNRDDKLEEKQVTKPPAHADKVNQAAHRTFSPDVWKVNLDAMIRNEEITGARLRDREKQSSLLLTKMDELLKLNAELTALPDGETVKFTDKIRDLITGLKSQGIDLWKDENTEKVAKEKVAELKSLITSHREKAQAENHNILTKMQNLASDLMAILENAKSSNRGREHFMHVISNNSAPKG